MIVQTALPSSTGSSPALLRTDARPLYIAPTGDTRVMLDGPALCVLQEERAQQLFPLRRLSRVYTGDWVDWTSEALIACAATGVTVVFVDNNGEVVARILGRPGQRDELYHRLTEFLLLPQAGGMYRYWREDQTRRAAWWAGVKLDVPPKGRIPARCRDCINSLAARYAGDVAGERSRQWLRSLAFTWMQGHLQDLGFGVNTELAQAGEPALARDLGGILMWYLEPARIGWLKRRHLAAKRKGQAATPPRHHDVVRLFESHATRAGVRGREITNLLHRWLVHSG